MKIALVQMKMNHDLKANLKNSLASMEKAAENGANLIVFPELQLSPFFPQRPAGDTVQYQVTIDHESVEKIRAKSTELGTVTIPNIYLKEKSGMYDACPVIEKTGKVLGISKMVHIVQIPQFYEQDYYEPSDTGFRVYDTSAGKIGVVICFDRHYPESIRTCVLQGAQIIVIPTAIVKGEPLETFEWEVRLAAWHNNVFIAMCNRVGIEDEMNFCGGSLVVDPDGTVIAQADDSEQILFADIDFSLINSSREKRDFLSLRKPDSYL